MTEKLIRYFESLIRAPRAKQPKTPAEHQTDANIPSKYLRRAFSDLQKAGLIQVTEIGERTKLDFQIPVGSPPSESVSTPVWGSQLKKRSPSPPATRQRIYDLDSARCAYCGSDVTSGKWHLEHVVPEQKGGGNGDDNLVVSCAPCNKAKRWYAPEDPGYLTPKWYRGRRVIGSPTYERRADGLYPVLVTEAEPEPAD